MIFMSFLRQSPWATQNTEAESLLVALGYGVLVVWWRYGLTTKVRPKGLISYPFVRIRHFLVPYK